MKARVSRRGTLGFRHTLGHLAISFLLGVAWPSRGDRPPDPLAIRQSEGRPLLAVPREPIAPVAGTRYRLRIESSIDLREWHPAGELQTGPEGQPVWIPPQGPAYEFFRLQPEIETGAEAADGPALFGFTRVFDEELAHAGWLTPEAFLARHQPGGEYLDALHFDPRQAKYWDLFSVDPAVANQGKIPYTPGWRSFDFRLNASEMDLFLKHGFVVSERLSATEVASGGGSSFASVFYLLFNNDLPVFISADSALHAWHFTYQRMLAEMEETLLAPLLSQILDGMAGALATTPASLRNGPLAASLRDADYLLAVGLSLLRGTQVSPVLGHNDKVAETLSAITSLRQPKEFEMFGANRTVDFTQYQVRGYYTRSLQLSRYFRASLWLSRTDLRVLPLASSDVDQSRREMGTAIVLALLLQKSGRTATWTQLDEVIRLFVGRSEAMNPAQLRLLLDAAGLTSLDKITRPEQVAALQEAVMAGDLGLQRIPAEAHQSPFGPEQAQLPRSFAFAGQRFVADGWALAEVTFDRVAWFEDIPNMTISRKVLRRVPTALDVLYSVLGNRQVGWEIGQRMLAPRRPGDFRDGLPYAHSLTALAATFDRFTLEAWTDTLYTRWLWALRALSQPTTGSEFPEAMRTRAWAMRTANTQLASYTELKHDTLLYGKQPYGAALVCEYPAGFVEPIPEFWARMRDLANAAADVQRRFPPQIQGRAPVTRIGDDGSGSSTEFVDGGLRNRLRIETCTGFASRMEQLRVLAQKELRQQPFTPEEEGFIRSLMNDSISGCVGTPYTGWYPGLFYNDYSVFGGDPTSGGDSFNNGSGRWDPLVADVFTAPPDLVDPKGGVLHEATGNIDFLMITVDNGPDRMVYAGPVSSHYEFLVEGPILQRLTDGEWQTRLGKHPPRPDWTTNYFIGIRR